MFQRTNDQVEAEMSGLRGELNDKLQTLEKLKKATRNNNIKR